jgi:hypothetical protein
MAPKIKSHSHSHKLVTDSARRLNKDWQWSQDRATKSYTSSRIGEDRAKQLLRTRKQAPAGTAEMKYQWQICCRKHLPAISGSVKNKEREQILRPE